MAPEECLQEVNRVLVREKVSSMFATCFYGLLNTRTGEVRYCSAGHNPPWILRASGEMEALRETGGIPLGLFDKSGYQGSPAKLGPGDTIFLYTDGVPEANNAQLDDFTDERLEASLRDSTALTCRQIIDRMTRDLTAFTAGAPQSDDITMLAIRAH
jgi:phosphoserine phosphatase RsbU/P